MPSVRPASIRDIPDIVRLGLRFLRESVFGSVIAENPEQMTTLAGEIIEGSRPGVIYMATDADDRPVGMVGGLFYVHPLSAEPMVTELFLYVEPDARGSIGVRLAKAFEGWIATTGAVANSLIQPIGEDRVAGLYDAMGYAPVEVAWMRRR